MCQKSDSSAFVALKKTSSVLASPLAIKSSVIVYLLSLKLSGAKKSEAHCCPCRTISKISLGAFSITSLVKKNVAGTLFLCSVKSTLSKPFVFSITSKISATFFVAVCAAVKVLSFESEFTNGTVPKSFIERK